MEIGFKKGRHIAYCDHHSYDNHYGDIAFHYWLFCLSKSDIEKKTISKLAVRCTQLSIEPEKIMKITSIVI